MPNPEATRAVTVCPEPMQQSNSLDFKLVQRVCLLQQALDQALSSLAELKAQVQDKQYVETQLANTEKFANVQQQAIAHLKQELAQFTTIQNDLLSVMGYRLNELIDQQQEALDQLNIQFHQSHAELQAYLQYLGKQRQEYQHLSDDTEACRLAVQAEVMMARSMAVHLSQHLGLAKQYLGQLKSDLGNHHLNLGHIIKTIQAMIAELKSFEGSEVEAWTRSDSQPVTLELPSMTNLSELMLSTDDESDLTVIRAALRRQDRRSQELEAALLEHLAQKAQLQQRYQQVAAERDYYRKELYKLRSQQADLPVLPLDEVEAEPTLSENPPSLRSGDPKFRRRSQPHPPIQPFKPPEETL